MKLMQKDKGIVFEEKIKEVSELTTNIEKAISLFPKTNKNFIVFRGVTIDAFKKYGMQNLNELNHLKEHFIYEDGFTSTALTKEASYFETEIENHGTSNILIKYYVPKEFNEGAPLTSDILSYKKEQLEFVISKIPKERITLLFSATINEEVKDIAEKYLVLPENIVIEEEEKPLEKIEQLYYAVDGLKKVDFMKKVINTKEQVDNLYAILKKWDNSVCAFHGGLEQTERQEILKDFKKGQYRILIATDLASRGIHVVGITHVINYGVPFEPEQYVHRIGRTGRVDETGVAITFVMPSEMERFKELEEFLGYKIPCKGGYVNTAPKIPNKNRRDAGRFKDVGNRKKTAIIRIDGGKTNSPLETRDILYTLRNIPDVNKENIGKIDIKDKITEVVIHGGKEETVLKALKKTGIKKKIYKVKIK